MEAVISHSTVQSGVCQFVDSRLAPGDTPSRLHCVDSVHTAAPAPGQRDGGHREQCIHSRYPTSVLSDGQQTGSVANMVRHGRPRFHRSVRRRENVRRFNCIINDSAQSRFERGSQKRVILVNCTVDVPGYTIHIYVPHFNIRRPRSIVRIFRLSRQHLNWTGRHSRPGIAQLHLCITV